MTKHARYRAKERYGFDLDIEEIKQMEQWIAQNNLLTFFLSFNEKGEFYAIRFNRKWMVAIVKNKKIVTFLTSNLLKNRSTNLAQRLRKIKAAGLEQ